jgi:hypothetical protein
MTQIKIVSNPYERSLEYFIYKEQSDAWENIKSGSINSRLRENDAERIFLPFSIKEIIDTIVSEYYAGNEKLELIFEGTTDEYDEVMSVCCGDDLREKVHLIRSTNILENARDILDHTKEIFDRVEPVITNIVKDDASITKALVKVSDALKDIIPVCIFGNYSAGKSTFINAMIGYEILPSGGDPVTSKIYEIKRSQQEDRARIGFAYKGEEFELFFDNKECRVLIGNKGNELIEEIFKGITGVEIPDLFHMVNISITIINNYEKRDKSTTLISNVIRLEVPFSDKGRLGQSRNEFVIFDTPGSNSNSNAEHSTVLAEALEGFSNGIPVWVSTYDNLDTNDNADLCNKILSIKALDKRFTMIVVNRADQADFEGEVLSEEQVAEILEYNSVEEMYASGIFFVSSIMGLGAKMNGAMNDKFYRKTFRQQKNAYSDTEDEYYTSLYKFNIMPAQIKNRVLKNSMQQPELIYANSGLYCIEEEMEEFASKYSAYNKCQMVYMFLKSIINETGCRIEEKTAIRERSKKKWEQDLGEKRFELISTIRNVTDDSLKHHEKDSKARMEGFVADSSRYEQTVEELDERDGNITKENSQDADFAAYERELAAVKSNREKNLKDNFQNLFKGNFIDSVKSLATEWTSDSKEVQQKREYRDATKRDIDKATSDQMLEIVIAEFKKNIVDAQNRIGSSAREYWLLAAQEYRDELIRLITGSEVLSEEQRTELSNIILQYQSLVFDDEADKVFIKAKFLRGNVLGIRLGTSEKLDNARLASRYNTKIRKDLEEMTALINDSCLDSFKTWQSNLLAVVEENITIYNPELREISEVIREESERILELQSNQQMISSSLETIENMMAWKDFT